VPVGPGFFSFWTLENWAFESEAHGCHPIIAMEDIPSKMCTWHQDLIPLMEYLLEPDPSVEYMTLIWIRKKKEFIWWIKKVYKSVTPSWRVIWTNQPLRPEVVIAWLESYTENPEIYHHLTWTLEEPNARDLIAAESCNTSWFPWEGVFGCPSILGLPGETPSAT